jgi:hypothetical protein
VPEAALVMLDPGRTSLSGRAVSNVQPPAAKGEPRRCCICSVEDQATPIDGEFDSMGRPKIEHLVTIELRYLKANTEAEARKLIRPPWKYRLHQARQAMERFVCRPCLRETAVMERDWTKKGAAEKRRNNQSYYGVLCGE